MDLTKFMKIREFESTVYSDLEISKKIWDKGWHLIAVRVERPEPESDGSYKDVLIYTLGHEDSEAR